MDIFTQNRVKAAGSAPPALGEGANISSTTTSYPGVYVTTFTFSDTQAVANAALGFGTKLATLPLGNVQVIGASLEMTYSFTGAGAITPEWGIGTAVGTGAVSVLGGTATFEDCINGTALTVTNGATPVTHTAYIKGEVDQKDGTSTAKTLYLNIAGDFTGVTDTLSYAGEVTVIWSILHT